MTDPFDALRRPVVPADPDPVFAATLRARLERALALPRGVAVTTTTEAPATAVAQGAAIPYLAVPVGEGRRALDWYADVLGAELDGEPIVMPDGRIGHSELALAGGKLYLSEEFPEIGVVAPSPAGTPVSLSLPVPDVAETMRRAVARGGRVPRAMYVGYAWLTVPDPDRAAAFYAAVLGWEYEPGYAPGGRNVVGRSLPMGIGRGEGGWHLSYAVDDVAAAVERVRAAGGTATDPEDRAYGPAADCVDVQGAVFALHPAGSGPRSAENGARPGDLSYLTLEVVDSAGFREFYGSVLGWTFTGGRAEDGWSVPGVSPMTGMQGGHAASAAIPMWKVDDVAAAVRRVRAAGGTASDPAAQPYGTTAECTDDQGLRFYLGDA